MIIDTHTHIYLNKKLTEDEIISNLKENGIKKIISVGVDLDSSKESIELAKKYPDIIYASIGIQPTDIFKYGKDVKGAINKLENMLLENIKYIRGIGETGFDYHRINKANFNEEKELQEEYFKAQIFLSKKYSLPLIIHTRDAKDDTLRILKETDLQKFIIHSFSGDLTFACRLICCSSESKLGFNGIVTYKSASDVKEVVSNIAIDKILLETDCPFLTPQEVRGKENQPSFIKYTLDEIFNLRKNNGKKETFEELRQEIFKNSKEFFDIG